MQESEAKQKWCPIGDYNCKASICMMWVESKVMKCLRCGAEYLSATRCKVCKTQVDSVKSGHCWLVEKAN